MLRPRMPVLYFAYGANMCRDVFVRRRRIVPGSAEPAWLPEHQLVFALRGIPWLEPAFATVVPAPGEVVHGVLYAIEEADMRRLDRRESSRYARRDMIVRTGGGEFHAQLYVARHPTPGLRPSRRYRDLLLRGARDHGLPEAWVRRLEAQDCAHVPVLSDLTALVAELLG